MSRYSEKELEVIRKINPSQDEIYKMLKDLRKKYNNQLPTDDIISLWVNSLVNSKIRIAFKALLQDGEGEDERNQKL